MALKTKHKKKPGRPATGVSPIIAWRAPPALRKEIDSWAKRQPDQPKLSAAVRRLVELGLKAKSR